MREVQKRQMQLDQVAIEDIRLDAKSRDDIPAVPRGFQHTPPIGWRGPRLECRVF